MIFIVSDDYLSAVHKNCTYSIFYTCNDTPTKTKWDQLSCVKDQNFGCSLCTGQPKILVESRFSQKKIILKNLYLFKAKNNKQKQNICNSYKPMLPKFNFEHFWKLSIVCSKISVYVVYPY